MSTRKANAIWNGTLKKGNGEMKFNNYAGPYTFASRFEEAAGTNPEELVGAALAGCYSMFLSALLSGEGLTPTTVETNATVELGKDDIGPNINTITLVCNVVCEGITKAKFDELAQAAKEKCPISRLYSGGTANIELKANLK